MPSYERFRHVSVSTREIVRSGDKIMKTKSEVSERCRDLPPFITVEQAAEILQIGRSKAYELSREFLDRGEGHGFPCVRVGHQIRVPLDRLLRLGDPGGSAAA